MRCCAIVLAIASVCAVHAETRWLAVVSTGASVEQAIASAKKLHASLGKVTIVSTNDCANLKPDLFLSSAGIFNDSDGAERKVSEARKTVHDAYVRDCIPKPASRMEFGIDLVDPTIFEAPSDTVNWDDADRISEVRPVGQMNVWIRRQYQKEENDPREGRRTSVWLFKKDPSSAQKLAADCNDARVVASDSAVALTCARETAGDNVLHQLELIDIVYGRVTRTVERCRDPKFVTAAELVCHAESVGPDGELKLSLKRIPLKVEVRSGTPGRPAQK